jgi:hypothetical protein
MIFELWLEVSFRHIVFIPQSKVPVEAIVAQTQEVQLELCG